MNTKTLLLTMGGVVGAVALPLSVVSCTKVQNNDNKQELPEPEGGIQPIKPDAGISKNFIVAIYKTSDNKYEFCFTTSGNELGLKSSLLDKAREKSGFINQADWSPEYKKYEDYKKVIERFINKYKLYEDEFAKLQELFSDMENVTLNVSETKPVKPEVTSYTMIFKSLGNGYYSYYGIGEATNKDENEKYDKIVREMLTKVAENDTEKDIVRLLGVENPNNYSVIVKLAKKAGVNIKEII